MKLFEIKRRISGRILFSMECDSMKLCVEAAVESDAVLRGADLRGADLRGAVLRGADLSDAVLRGADLSGADLSGADLRGADLRGADLRGAVLRDADLRDADLRDADLSGADLSGADLRDADLSGADLSSAVMDIPCASDQEAIANLDRVREIIIDNHERLNMGHWHGDDEWKNRTCAEETICGTTHCLAGWLQVCSTRPAVKDLAAVTAGILEAPIASHMFFRGDAEALDWLKNRKYAEGVDIPAADASEARK